MASYILMNLYFVSEWTVLKHEFFKIIFNEMRNKRLIHCEPLF